MDNLLFYVILLVLILGITYLLRKNPKLKNEIQEGIKDAVELYQEARELVGEEVFDSIIEEIQEELEKKKKEFIKDVNEEYNVDLSEFDDAIYEKVIQKTNVPINNQQVNFVVEQVKNTLNIELEIEKIMNKK